MTNVLNCCTESDGRPPLLWRTYPYLCRRQCPSLAAWLLIKCRRFVWRVELFLPLFVGRQFSCNKDALFQIASSIPLSYCDFRWGAYVGFSLERGVGGVSAHDVNLDSGGLAYAVGGYHANIPGKFQRPLRLCWRASELEAHGVWHQFISFVVSCIV